MALPHRTQIPPQSAFARYLEVPGAYADCYAIKVKGAAKLEGYTNAFFSTWLFRLELLVLRLFGSSNVTEQDRENLARGASDQFGLWRVETRDQDEMVLSVGDGPIRTWLRVQPDRDDPSATLLVFGSAVLPRHQNRDGTQRLDRITQALTPIHQAYSILLLRAAAQRWARRD